MDWELLVLASVGVVGFCEWLKSFDKKQKLAKVYGLFPLIISFAVGLAFVPDGFVIGTYLVSSFVVLGVSVLGYEAIMKFIKKRLEQANDS
jgi:hypothetical protein